MYPQPTNPKISSPSTKCISWLSRKYLSITQLGERKRTQLVSKPEKNTCIYFVQQKHFPSGKTYFPPKLYSLCSPLELLLPAPSSWCLGTSDHDRGKQGWPGVTVRTGQISIKSVKYGQIFSKYLSSQHYTDGGNRDSGCTQHKYCINEDKVRYWANFGQISKFLGGAHLITSYIWRTAWRRLFRFPNPFYEVSWKIWLDVGYCQCCTGRQVLNQCERGKVDNKGETEELSPR